MFKHFKITGEGFNQNYESPFVTLADRKDYWFILVVFAVTLTLLLFGLVYSVYCSYPTIRRDLSKTLCVTKPNRGSVTGRSHHHSQRSSMSFVSRIKEFEVSPNGYTPIINAKDEEEQKL